MARVFIGVLRAELYIPGARTLKDRRRLTGSLVDRLRHRFDVAVALVGAHERAQQETLAVTAVGSSTPPLRQLMDMVAAHARQHPEVLVQDLDVEVFRWHAEHGRWNQEVDDG